VEIFPLKTTLAEKTLVKFLIVEKVAKSILPEAHLFTRL
jgi:hypothetical protein